MRTSWSSIAIVAVSAQVLCAQAAPAPQTPAAPRPDLPIVAARTINLDTDEGTWISLDVSPDGRTIVFDLLGDLYTLPIAGGTATQLTRGMHYDAQPRFSPDGRFVVFTSDKDGGDNVWTIDVNTKALKQITRGKASRYRSPEWTPDGMYVVVSRAPGPIGPSKPWIYHKDGGSGIQLVRDPAPLPNGAFPLSIVGAAFGKDGRYIWFAQRNGAWEYNAGFPQHQLITFDRETGRRDTRANMLGGAVRPALSPDGKYLAYASRFEAQSGIRLRDFETGDEKWLAYPVQRDEQESVASLDAFPGYSFTPDSRALIMSYGGKIWRVPVDGSAQTNIPFRVQTTVEMGPKLAFNYRVSDSAEFIVRQIRDAVPSPNGRQLAFVAMDKLYVMDYPGGTPRRVTSNADITEAQPAWSPDGSQIAFVTWSPKDGGALWKVGAGGGTPQRLTQSRAMYQQPAWNPGGSRIVLSRAPAQSVMEEGGFIGAAELVWVPSGGGAANLIAPSSGRTQPHFTRDSSRIFLSAGGALVSVRWDGTDEKTHVRVTGATGPEATAPSPAGVVRVSPTGDQVLAQVSNDLFVFPLVESGEPATVGLANPDAASLPTKRITDIGGQFPAWSADGSRVHFSIGNAHAVYDLTRGRQFDDSVTAARAAMTPPPAGAAPRYEPVETKITLRAKRDTPEGTAVFRGARIVSMKGNEVIENGDIVVRNNRIVGVGRRGAVQVPAGARVFDVSGKTIVPGFVDTHAHLGLRGGIHQQPWSYLANLAYGVTTTRDPQTGTTDVLAYEDLVTAGEEIGPRVYSTGPGLFSLVYQPGIGEEIRDQEHARKIMRRYSQYYDTKTLKMYVGGNRQQRQWILTAAREQNIMPTTEGALDTRYDMTMAIDGYPGQEHAIPVFPIYKDVVALFAQSGIAYTPTLIVSYNGPFGENYFYAKEQPYKDAKLKRFTPYEELAGKSRRRVRGQRGGGNEAGWYSDDEYTFDKISKAANDIQKAGGLIGVGSHGQLQGMGYHWEMWMLGMGGMTNHNVLKAATIDGALALGLSMDLGSLEAGKLADFVVLDANPLTNIRNTNTVRMVMKNGRLYDGNTLDETYPRQRKTDPVAGTAIPPKTGAGIP